MSRTEGVSSLSLEVYKVPTRKNGALAWSRVARLWFLQMGRLEKDAWSASTWRSQLVFAPGPRLTRGHLSSTILARVVDLKSLRGESSRLPITASLLLPRARLHAPDLRNL